MLLPQGFPYRVRGILFFYFLLISCWWMDNFLLGKIGGGARREDVHCNLTALPRLFGIDLFPTSSANHFGDAASCMRMRNRAAAALRTLFVIFLLRTSIYLIGAFIVVRKQTVIIIICYDYLRETLIPPAAYLSLCLLSPPLF